MPMATAWARARALGFVLLANLLADGTHVSSQLLVDDSFTANRSVSAAHCESSVLEGDLSAERGPYFSLLQLHAVRTAPAVGPQARPHDDAARESGAGLQSASPSTAQHKPLFSPLQFAAVRTVVPVLRHWSEATAVQPPQEAERTAARKNNASEAASPLGAAAAVVKRRPPEREASGSPNLHRFVLAGRISLILAISLLLWRRHSSKLRADGSQADGIFRRKLADAGAPAACSQ
eukprot:TRINITY_DN17876_c0_g1_i1.p1 TRINITY_DN17876_c0_g1~~TRINITY_DN17876_c0_g1_i1.p1  ORF type:complete len:269 (-),score=51.80 TRINITY_DN17876_c0_g1_i1:72-776(-)